MDLRISKSRIIKYLKILLILLVILTSGSDYFMNRHMQETMFFFLFMSLIFLFFSKWKINKNILYLAFFLLFLQFLSSVVNIKNGFATNDAIIVIMKFICIIIICSNITIDEFKIYYIKIVYYISIISLFCFIALLCGVKTLPFMHVFPRTNDTAVWATFYYTIGWGGFFGRNAGLFWEPGAFQIIINIAIFFRLSMKNIKIDKYLIILFITLFTTMSTTGYVCLAFNLVYLLNISNNVEHKFRYYLLILFGVIALLVIDNNTGIITDKIINKGGSFATRNLDTITGYFLSLKKPLFGYGSFNTVVTDILKSFRVYNISNGLAGFLLYNGYPFVFIYLICLFKSLYIFCDKKIISSLVIFAMFVIFFNTEYIMPLTLFWLFCFAHLMKSSQSV